MINIAKLPLTSDTDAVLVRQSVRHVCERLRVDDNERTRFAAAVSEIIRNAVQHGGGGTVEIALDQAAMQLVVNVRDRGPGIPDDVWLGGRGNGIQSARKLVDGLEISRGPSALVTLTRTLRNLPIVNDALITSLREAVARDDGRAAADELFRQNRELTETFAALKTREEELARLNRELAETNSGVLALYAELEEQTEALKRAAESKERFYSEMNHELRTPLNAIMSLADIISDGTITDFETLKKPVGFLRKSAQQMAELVDDLLDLARVEAGKMTLRVTEFAVADVVGALRGVFRQLHTNENVQLIFDDRGAVGTMRSDEGKIAQVLRNFVSNALKFTDSGEVRLTVTAEADRMRFDVTDTGIGIAPHDQERLFEAFSRIESPKRRQVKGTGLGLTVSKRLATLLGGEVEFASELGRGSRFSLVIPTRVNAESDKSILLIDDDEVARYLMKEMLRPVGVTVHEASSGSEGLALIKMQRPTLVLLDLNMPGMSGLEVLDAIRNDAATRDLPVIINTSQPLSDAERAKLEERTLAVLSKDGSIRQSTQATLERALASVGL